VGSDKVGSITDLLDSRQVLRKQAKDYLGRYNNTPMQILGFLTPKEKRKISA
jgi:hypothetical protein